LWLQHLKGYGWPIGRQIVDLYAEAEEDRSLRGQHRREYNKGMRELMGNILL
jgi:hypothetical protein